MTPRQAARFALRFGSEAPTRAALELVPVEHAECWAEWVRLERACEPAELPSGADAWESYQPPAAEFEREAALAQAFRELGADDFRARWIDGWDRYRRTGRYMST